MTVKGSPRIEHYLVSEWDYELNGELEPTQIARWSWKKHWWRCPDGHSYYSAPATRSKGRGCPYCAGTKILVGFNDLCTVRPDLAASWDVTLNAPLLPKDVTQFSDNHVWWRCDKGHSWKLRIAQRSLGVECRYCSNKAVLPGFNDLKSLYPEIAEQLDEPAIADPSTLVAGSHRSLHWKCSYGHQWKASAKTRIAGIGCPYCAGVKVLKGYNDLETCSPEIAAQWDEEKNTSTPSEVHHGSKSRAWWRCLNGHSWNAVIQSRKNRGCPNCALAGTSQSEQKMYSHLNTILHESKNRVKVGLEGWKRGIEVDVVGLWQGGLVAVEYDGSYFHRDSFEKDEDKTAALLDAGYTVVRVREQNYWSLMPLRMKHPRLLQVSHQFDTPMDQMINDIRVWLESLEGSV